MVVLRHFLGVLSFLLLLAASLACGSDTTSPDAGGGGNSDGATPDGAFPGLSLEDFCLIDDGDVLDPLPIANESLSCTGNANPDATAPLFDPGLGPLPAEYAALHALCLRMNHAPNTTDHNNNAALKADILAFFGQIINRPALARVLANAPAGTAERVDRLADVWLPDNAFEHVFCGELSGSEDIGGFHFWGEHFFEEQAGRANYLCTVEGQDDPDVATIRFTWQPEGITTGPRLKPIGGFQVGMSPSCLLALGYRIMAGAERPNDNGSLTFRAQLYGHWVEWLLGTSGRGNLVTVYPMATP